MSWMYNGVV